LDNHSQSIKVGIDVQKLQQIVTESENEKNFIKFYNIFVIFFGHINYEYECHPFQKYYVDIFPKIFSFL
jgi:hypothetical protein